MKRFEWTTRGGWFFGVCLNREILRKKQIIDITIKSKKYGVNNNDFTQILYSSLFISATLLIKRLIKYIT